jgi:hypothetical protein
MNRLLYISDSLVGNNLFELGQIMATARKSNKQNHLTGLLWTDGVQFAQVIEGEEEPISELLERLMDDPRHKNLDVLMFANVEKREFDDWYLNMLFDNPDFEFYQERMNRQLATMDKTLADKFKRIMSGAKDTDYSLGA